MPIPTCIYAYARVYSGVYMPTSVCLRVHDRVFVPASTCPRLYAGAFVCVMFEVWLQLCHYSSHPNLERVPSRYYATIIAETRAALQVAIPTVSVSVDVGWSSDNIDGRYYDVKKLAAAADFLYVMDYDVRSQVWYGWCGRILWR